VEFGVIGIAHAAVVVRFKNALVFVKPLMPLAVTVLSAMDWLTRMIQESAVLLLPNHVKCLWLFAALANQLI